MGPIARQIRWTVRASPRGKPVKNRERKRANAQERDWPLDWYKVPSTWSHSVEVTPKLRSG